MISGCLTFIIVGAFLLAPFSLIEALILGNFDDLNIWTVGLGLVVGIAYFYIVYVLIQYIKKIKDAEKYMQEHPNENINNKSTKKTEKPKEPYKAKANKSFEE